MATLVFSTIGTALGGPLGGAIGALLGQSIDQELLGPSVRGPRLGDLSVQTSSYGTQVPRVYGSMRVAGSVIWATDLVESSETTGAKGQPDTTFSYSVSLAVALSSRPLRSIGRIWADGKLLRGEDGDFKVSTTFRFYEGGEDQNLDPLIASIEGIANSPAYRGLALAVFENLELADFGNRIPFLTFEVMADDEPPTAGQILADASSGAIADAGGQAVTGYAAYGASIKAALAPLIDSFAIDLFDDGLQLRPAASSVIPIPESDLGNSAGEIASPRIEREQAPMLEMPASLRLSYYDPARDYQSGEARASSGDEAGKEERMELPAVLDGSAAKSLVQQALARKWAERDRLVLRLPPRLLGLEPGAEVEVPTSPPRWVVDACTIDSFVVVAELRPARRAGEMLAADSGRIVDNPDVADGGTVLALVETPLELSPNVASVMLAASTPTAGWRSRAVEITIGGQTSVVRTAARKSKLGRAASDLPADQAYDIVDTVEVELIDQSQWLTSCDDAALAAGANLAFVGSEILQFGDAIPVAPGRFELGRLLRGRDGTDGAMTGHRAGEWFVLIEPDALRVIQVPSSAIGSEVSATTVGVSGTVEARATIGTEASRPLRGSALLLDGIQVVGARRPAIASPSGGSTTDSEARATLDQLLNAMRAHGLIEM
jgi:hypothetical protein